MTLRQRYRNWVVRRRWRKAGRNEDEPLREFVYLDDVSVYSLVASQVGMIVTELTETQATSLQSDISGSARGNGWLRESGGRLTHPGRRDARLTGSA